MSQPVVIFDLGKVLVDFDYSIAARKIAARSSKSPDNLHAFLGSSHLLIQYECGQLSREQFYEGIASEIGFNGSLAEFSGYFADIFSEMPEPSRCTLNCAAVDSRLIFFPTRTIWRSSTSTGILSFFKNFDGYIFSYKIGAMKPDAKIYEAMETLCGSRGADLIYLDDRAENIAAGAARGWQAILHESPEKTRRELARLKII